MPTIPKRRRHDYAGTYSVLHAGVAITTLAIARQWTPGGALHIVTLADGRSESACNAAYALTAALRLVAPGAMVRPWFDAGTDGWRLKAHGTAPWDASEQEVSDG